MRRRPTRITVGTSAARRRPTWIAYAAKKSSGRPETRTEWTSSPRPTISIPRRERLPKSLWSVGVEVGLLLRTNEQLRALGIRLESTSSFPGALSFRFGSDRGPITIAIEKEDWQEMPTEHLELDALRQVMAAWEGREPPPSAEK